MSSQPPAARKTRRLYIVGLIVLVAVASSAATFAALTLRTKESFDIEGNVTVTNTRICGTGRTYFSGAPVVVTDGTGKAVAVGALDSIGYLSAGGCDFTFTVRSIPAGLDIYGILIANRQPPAMFSETDL